MALGGLVAVTCLAGVMIVSWSHVVDRAVELADKSSAAEGGLVSEIGKYNVAGRLLKDRRAVQSLSAQYKQAQKDLKKQSLMLQPSPASDLSGKLQQAKNALEKTTDEVVNAGAQAKSAAGLKSTAGPDQSPSKVGKLGFISGDRFGHDHVFRDGGYGPRDLVGDEEAHYDAADWPEPPRPEYGSRAFNNDDDFDSENARHHHPYDIYLGFHPSVHDRDDRDVYSDGYGDHYGVHYDRQPNDRFGDFFHGRTAGYDWFHPEHPHEDIGPGEFAWSMDHDPVIGDEGYSRYRPNFYMDWDGSGRSMDETKTMGDEDFMEDPAGAGFKQQRPQTLRLVNATPKQQAEMMKLQREIRVARARLMARKAGVRKQQLTLRQDRNGENAEPTLGRWHGCSPQQIVAVPGDDCDPLALKMAPMLARHADQLAERAEKTFAGVHWTSGDIDPREDALPLREVHGGYAGIADIEYPADKVYPTMYHPIVGNGVGSPPKAIGTKASEAPTLKGEKAAALEGEQKEEAARLKVKEATKRAQMAMAAAKEAKEEEAAAVVKVKVGDQVMRDALTKESGQDRIKLLKAATEEYEEAAEEKKEAEHPAEPAAAPAQEEEEQASEGEAPSEQQEAGQEEEQAGEEEVPVTAAVQRAMNLVKQEQHIRQEAKSLKEEEEVKVQAARDERDVVKATLAKLLPADPAADQ